MQNVEQLNAEYFATDNKINIYLRKIVDLQAEKQKIIQLLNSDSEQKNDEISLSFDDIRKTILWNYNRERFTKKQYLLIKTLWTSEEHEVTIDEIEEQVWSDITKQEKTVFIEKHTIFTLIRRAQNKLKKCDFPYKIISVKNFSTRENIGYKLIRAQ